MTPSRARPAQSSARPSPTASSSAPTKSSTSTSPSKSFATVCARARSTLPKKWSKSLANFFRKGNLNMLRELALRTTAEQVGTAAAEYRRNQGLEQAPIPEKVMVCLSPRPGMERLLRVGARIAGRLATNWYVVYVEPPDHDHRHGDPEAFAAHGRVPQRMARDLGARSSLLKDKKVADALIEFARRRTSPTWSSASRPALAGTSCCAAPSSTASSPKCATPPSRSSPSTRNEDRSAVNPLTFRRFPLLFLFFLCVAPFARAADTDRLNALRIADGVWFLPGDSSKGYCNNIAIEMKDYLIVIDANYPGRARELVRDIHQLSPKPVLFVFDTHAHRDHAYGNVVWTDAGATTFAYQGVVDEMNRYEPQRWLATAAEREDVRALNLTDAPRPELTFRTSPFILKDSTREVQFWFLGWAHTRGRRIRLAAEGAHPLHRRRRSQRSPQQALGCQHRQLGAGPAACRAVPSDPGPSRPWQRRRPRDSRRPAYLSLRSLRRRESSGRRRQDPLAAGPVVTRSRSQLGAARSQHRLRHYLFRNYPAQAGWRHSAPLEIVTA